MSVAVSTGSGATVAADVVGSAAEPSSGQQIQYVKLDAGTGGVSTPVKESSPLPVAQMADVITVTLTLDTNAYTANDVLSATQEIASAVLANGRRAMLESLVVLDEDDQTAAGIDFVFFTGNTALGSENSAPNISDADARDILGTVSVASGDFIDLGGSKVATVRNIGLLLEAGGSSTSVYFATITRGTPTQTATGIQVRFGLVRY